MELEECIKDAFDASLEEYMKSKDYISERQRTTEKLKTFRAGLSDIQRQQFNEIIDAISDDNSKLASEAYIRKRIAEMQKERYAKDTENKQFYERQQEGHRNHNMKILGSLAVVSGLVYTFRKPLAEAGKKLITKI